MNDSLVLDVIHEKPSVANQTFSINCKDKRKIKA